MQLLPSAHLKAGKPPGVAWFPQDNLSSVRLPPRACHDQCVRLPIAGWLPKYWQRPPPRRHVHLYGTLTAALLHTRVGKAPGDSAVLNLQYLFQLPPMTELHEL